MKFKIASVLELIIPLSVALMVSAFLGCGGGSYGDGTSAYDGTWSLNLKGYPLPAPATGFVDDDVSCDERFTTIEITHGSGSTIQIEDCTNAVAPTYYHEIHVVMTPAASGIGGTILATTFNGSQMEGTCPDRLTCTATPGLTLFKCGQAGGSC